MATLQAGRAAQPRPAEFRYGAVFALALLLVVWLIVTPGTDVTRAIGLALESAALVVAVATSRARVDVRRERTVAGPSWRSLWWWPWPPERSRNGRSPRQAGF